MQPRSMTPLVAITMGDAAGIGPGIIVKALARAEVYRIARPLVIGDRTRLARAARIARVSVGVATITGPGDASFQPGTIDCIDLGLIPEDMPFGCVSADAGEAAFRYVE